MKLEDLIDLKIEFKVIDIIEDNNIINMKFSHSVNDGEELSCNFKTSQYKEEKDQFDSIKLIEVKSIINSVFSSIIERFFEEKNFKLPRLAPIESKQ